MKMDKKLTRCYYDVKDVKFGSEMSLEDGVLTVSKEALKEEVRPLLKAVKSVDFLRRIRYGLPLHLRQWR